MASLRFNIGALTFSVSSTGVRVGSKFGGTLLSQKLMSFTKAKTNTKHKKEE